MPTDPKMPHTQTSAPVEQREPEDVRDERSMPREAGADQDAGQPRIPTENLDEDIGD
jgi:hypothetical protein